MFKGDRLVIFGRDAGAIVLHFNGIEAVIFEANLCS